MRRGSRVQAAVGLLFGVSLACAPGALLPGCRERVAPSPALATLPVDVDALDPVVGRQIREAHEAYLSRPGDAQAAARLGAVLAANNLPEAAAEAYAEAVRLQRNEPRWRYLLGLERLRAGQVDEALAEWERLREEGVAYPPMLWRMGMAYFEAGALDEAQEAFEAFVQQRGDSPMGYYGLGLVARSRGRLEEARDHLLRALADGEGFSALLYALGMTLRDLGQADEAERWLMRARRASRDYPLVDEWLAETGERSASLPALFDRARRLGEQGRHDEAVALLREAQGRNPDIPRIYRELVLALVRARRLDEAAAAADEFAARFPEHPDVHAVRARLYYALGEPRAALKEIDRAIARDDGVARYHLSKAAIARALQDWATMEAALREAVRLVPGRAMARASLAEALLAQHKYEAALAEAERAVALADDLAYAHFQVGLAAGLLGERDRAIRAFQRVLELDPANGAARKNLAALVRGEGLGDAGGGTESARGGNGN